MVNLKRFFSDITSKKNHLEFFTALLSIPVLLTVIMLNLSNLNTKKAPETSTEKPNQIIISLPAQSKELIPTAIPTKPACKPGIGGISISSPAEGEIVSDNPVSVVISYNPGDFCAVVWSYRINGKSWSEYDDKSVALYDLPSGNVSFELRVKSVINGGGDTTITRNFISKTSALTPTAVVPNTPSVTPSPTNP